MLSFAEEGGRETSVTKGKRRTVQERYLIAEELDYLHGRQEFSEQLGPRVGELLKSQLRSPLACG